MNLPCSERTKDGRNDERGPAATGPVLAPCPCGEDAVWHRARMMPEMAPEHAVCFLTDADFADNYCDKCFVLAVPRAERAGWERLPTD